MPVKTTNHRWLFTPSDGVTSRGFQYSRILHKCKFWLFNVVRGWNVPVTLRIFTSRFKCISSKQPKGMDVDEGTDAQKKPPLQTKKKRRNFLKQTGREEGSWVCLAPHKVNTREHQMRGQSRRNYGINSLLRAVFPTPLCLPLFEVTQNNGINSWQIVRRESGLIVARSGKDDTFHLPNL